MKLQKVKLKNRVGLHTRTAAIVASKALQFKSDISLQKDNLIVNGKSILDLLMLQVLHNNYVTIITDGQDEDEALRELTLLFNSSL